MSRSPHHTRHFHSGKPVVLRSHGVSVSHINVPPLSNPPPNTRRWRALEPIFRTAQMLLRKEVIQPHLPVRLPCYDFVPITSPTFDGSFPKGLGHRLRVLPTFVT